MATKAAFLGRNGVINAWPKGGILNLAEFSIYMDSAKALNTLGANGYFLAVVANEKGFLPDRNYPRDLAFVEKRIKSLVYAPIDFRCCTHHFSVKCECRMPRTGLIDWFIDKYDLDMENSIMIAGHDREAMAAKNAGIKHILRVATGKGQWSKPTQRYPIHDTISEAAEAVVI